MYQLVPRPRLRHAKSSRPSDSWWRTRLKEHPFKAASLAVLTIGGLSLLVFFMWLGVMPDLDLAGASATMAAVAMIGLLVAAALGGSTLAAGITARNLITSQADVFQSRWTVAIFATPAVVAFVGFAALSAWGDNWTLPIFGLCVLLLMVTLLLIRALALLLSDAFEPPAGSSSNKTARTLEIVIGLLGGGFIWLVMPLFAFFSFASLWPVHRPSSEFGNYLAIWGLLCVAMNVAIIYLPKKHEIINVTFMGLLTVFLLLVLTQNWPGIPLAAVRTLGLGETPVALVLTERGCHTLNQATRGQTICQLDAEKKTGWACPVVLKSRIGSPFVVEVTSFDTNGKWPAQLPIPQQREGQPPTPHALKYQRIQIPKNDVLSWPAIEPLKKPGKDFHFDAKRLTSVWIQETEKMSAEQTDWMHTQCGSPPPTNSGAGEHEATTGGKEG